jgi:hypothetical protein
VYLANQRHQEFVLYDMRFSTGPYARVVAYGERAAVWAAKRLLDEPVSATDELEADHA